MIFRKFQVREFYGTYSVIFNHDLPNDQTIVYENNKLINLPYVVAVQKAREMEEEFKNGKLKVDVTDNSEWIIIS
ncbi:MAG: hypothetical protein K0R54_1819 [Clostridiaceae bacterium]|jgi:hypothetical protein|nr:hypothetical protein [Clostridiaceae bacterium]